MDSSGYLCFPIAKGEDIGSLSKLSTTNTSETLWRFNVFWRSLPKMASKRRMIWNLNGEMDPTWDVLCTQQVSGLIMDTLWRRREASSYSFRFRRRLAAHQSAPQTVLFSTYLHTSALAFNLGAKFWHKFLISLLNYPFVAIFCELLLQYFVNSCCNILHPLVTRIIYFKTCH